MRLVQSSIEPIVRTWKVSDYFTELYIAGRFADAGWNVYFPHRDMGFDFIGSKQLADNSTLIRPIQVKGKYPWEDKGDRTSYGYIGRLTLHPDMVLVIVYFSPRDSSLPACTAYMPFSSIRPHRRGYRCQPASFKGGEPQPRRDYEDFFEEVGLRALEEKDWGRVPVDA